MWAMPWGGNEGGDLHHVLLHGARTIVFLLAVSGMSAAQASASSPKPGVKQQPSGGDFLNTAANVHYVGSKVCASCHMAIYEKYLRTAMGHSTTLPGSILDAGWLSKPVDIFNQAHNRHYQVFAKGTSVYESEYELDDRGKEVFRHEETLAYVVGTGQNGVTPLVRRGNYLFQAPLSYYTAKKAWDLSPNYEVKDLGFTMPVTPDCIGCHSGRTQPAAGQEGLYQDPPVVELGIGCENCHGPGELHVLERQTGAPLAAGDRSIVNPAKLPPWLADNICMSCHEGDIRALQAGRAEADFRPGSPLNQTVIILKSPINPQSAETPLLEHYYSMTLSKCYRSSSGKMNCESCHDPHVQPPAQEAAEYFRGRCLGCHTEKSCSLDLQQRRAQQPADACWNCHMPKQPALTVSHSALTDHRIVRTASEPYPESAFQGSAAETGFIHVNAVPGQPDSVPPVALLRAYRQELIRSRLEYKDDYFALLERLAKEGNRDPFVLSALAQKDASDGNLAKAIVEARQVVDQGSTSTYDYLLLDGLLARAGDLAGCVAVLKKGISIAPYNNLLYENLAVRQMSMGNIDEGVKIIGEGLELFPEDEPLREMQQQARVSGLMR